LSFPFYVGYALRAAYLIGHPEVEPYFDRAWLVVMRDSIAGLVLFWLAFLAWGSLERRRAGSHRADVVLGTFSWWAGTARLAYGLGPITSPAWIAILVGVVAMSLMLPRGTALAGIGFGLSLIVASHVAVGFGLLPYGPMMATPPVAGGRIELPHLVGAMTASV